MQKNQEKLTQSHQVLKERLQKLKAKNKSHVALKKRMQTKIKILEQKVNDDVRVNMAKKGTKMNKKGTANAYRSDDEVYDQLQT